MAAACAQDLPLFLPVPLATRTSRLRPGVTDLSHVHTLLLANAPSQPLRAELRRLGVCELACSLVEQYASALSVELPGRFSFRKATMHTCMSFRVVGGAS